ncbi:PREDICTED: protein FAM169B isoform X2 [Galeopterus variegatus]|uniref:Protein FAM169B isoform X2 n=1 Tax=Galeopterus variegatus TaxID=482537 RepID=A0ABM0R851_GALVR|nr:PREDICTED: protein FAM169B isoform X2 [Galeopterus variegatus]
MTLSGIRRQLWLTMLHLGKELRPQQTFFLFPLGSRLNLKLRLFAFSPCTVMNLNIRYWFWLIPRKQKQVQSFGERIVLFILNVVIFGRSERNLDDDAMFFLPHSAEEQAKILWRHGAAVGFYTTKMKGSLCGDGTGSCYLLPVFDTVFIRRQHRRQGLGTFMLQDFCETFREDEALGVSCPISPAMYQVCRRFLSACPEERARLWEVEPPGAWGQRTNIWLKVQLQQARLPGSHPGNPEEDMNGQGWISQEDGPGQSSSRDGSKERVRGEELENTEND